MTTLFVENSGTTDFRGGAAETNIDQIVFQTPGPGSASALFERAQFGPGLISDTVAITGDAFVNFISVVFASAGTFSAADWQFTDWTAGVDKVVIDGSNGDDDITGSIKDDLIGARGLDHIDCDAGNDQIQVGAALTLGTTLDGGSEEVGGVDSVVVTVAGTTDLRPATITDVEELSFSLNNLTVILSGDQFGAGGIEQFRSVGTNNALIVRDASVDLSGLTITVFGIGNTITIEGTSATTNGLTGSDQKDTISGSGNSFDDMTGGDGADTLNGGGGNDEFLYNAAGEVDAGETINGGASLDTIRLTNAGANDFSLATIVDVETLDFLSGNSTATFAGDSFDSGEIGTVSGSTGIDQLIVTTDDQLTDLVNVAFGTWTDGTDTITILGSALGDILGGSAQADIIDGGGEADFMHGEVGNDTYIVNVSNNSVNETAGEGTDLVQSSVTYALSLSQEIENLTLTGNAAINGTGNGIGNVITGNGAANTLAGLGGNDTLAGLGGTDTASYVGAAAGVTVSLAITTAQNTVGDGTDTLSSIENLTGSNFADTLTGNSGDNTLSGGNENDTLNGGAGNDTLNGDANVDTASYAGAASGVAVSLGVAGAQNTSGAGTDTLSGIESLTGSSFGDTLTGNGVGNVLSGGNGVDKLNGEGGNDILDGGIGADIMQGGLDGDTYVVDSAGDVVTEAAGGGSDLVKSSVSHTLAANVENLELTGTAGTNGTGNAQVNLIVGNSGVNRIDGGIGGDTMFGGNGNDTFVVDSSGDAIGENAGFGIDTVESSVSHTLAANVEKLILTGTAGTDGTGNSLVNTITGNSGVNRIDGGIGADQMAGGNGNDTYVVDSSGDVITEQANFGIDTVESSVTHTLAANVDKLTLTGTAGTNGTGNALVNTIIGNSAANRIDGGGAADTMQGGLGNDTYVVDSGSDTITEAAGAGTGVDSVESSVTHTLAANVENLTLTGASGTNATGNASANTIIGNSGGNRIDGDAQNDTLTGGTGNDDFVFDDGDGADTVTDFQNGNDQFDLSAVAGIDDIGDITIIDNGATVTVNYGAGSFTITNLADPASLDAGDFIF